MLENITKSTEDYDFFKFFISKSAVKTDCILLNKATADGGNLNFQTLKGLDLGMISLTSGESYGVSEYITCLIEKGIYVNHIDKYYGNSILLYTSRFIDREWKR